MFGSLEVVDSPGMLLRRRTSDRSLWQGSCRASRHQRQSQPTLKGAWWCNFVKMALSLLEIERRLLNWVTVFSSSSHLACVYTAQSPRWSSVHACAQEAEEEGDSIQLHMQLWFMITLERISGRTDAEKCLTQIRGQSGWKSFHYHFEKDKSWERELKRSKNENDCRKSSLSGSYLKHVM